MASFDSTLNSIIPWVVAFIGLYLLYRPLKEPLSPLFNGIGKIILSIKNKITGEDQYEKEPSKVDSLEYE